MKQVRPFTMSAGEKAALKRRLAPFQNKGAISFGQEPELASEVAALGLQQEVGTHNDELARFVFDATTGVEVVRQSLRAELVRYGSAVGVRIWAVGSPALEIRFPGIRPLFHPGSSADELLLFPLVAAHFVQSQGVEPLIVIPWAMNTIFGGFHPADGYYQTNLWELKNIDAIRYARLVEGRQLAFLGTHDLVAHIAGTRAEPWSDLTKVATRVREHLEDYVAGVSQPNLSSLILPYMAGILLDDLAQPPCYGAESRLIVLDAILKAIDRDKLSPSAPFQLLTFPTNYTPIIELARYGQVSRIKAEIPQMVTNLVSEILATSVSWQ